MPAIQRSAAQRLLLQPALQRMLTDKNDACAALVPACTHPSCHGAAVRLLQEGLQTVLTDKDNVFHCHNPHKMDAGGYSAQRASMAVLQAGFNLDTLMLRYQGAPARSAACAEKLQALP